MEEHTMTSIFIRHRVADYDTWKVGYDSADHLRKSDGIIFASVHRDSQDPNTVIVLHRFHNLADAQKFLASVPPVMAAAGVVGQPEIWVGEDIEHTNYN